MRNQGRQDGFSNNYSQGWRSNQNQNFGWNQESGPFQQQQQSLYPLVTKRLNKLEDT